MLGLESVAKEGVTAGCVDEESALPSLAAAVVVLRPDHGAFIAGQEFHVAHAAAFDDVGAFATGIADQDLVELGTAHLVGVRHGLVPGVGEFERLAVFVPRGDELRSPFLHSDTLYLSAYAQPLEQRQVGRQQGFADVEAGVACPFQQR